MAENKQRETADWAWSESGDAEIPANDWERFLESFTKQHQGWIASVATVSEKRTSMQAIACRVQRITSEASQIRFSMECERGNRIEESVTKPVRLVFKRDEEGAHQGLDVVSSDRSVTMLRFRAPVRPEILDGVLNPVRTK